MVFEVLSTKSQSQKLIRDDFRPESVQCVAISLSQKYAWNYTTQEKRCCKV